MADVLVEGWRLAVLRVQLDLSPREPEVACDLVGYPTGTARTMSTQRYPLTAFGLQRTARDGVPLKSLTVPEDLQVHVSKVLHGELNGEAALWLRLVPPYGYLGAVPWESSLVEATGLPLLRVPDRLPPAADMGSTWRAAIVLSAPPRTKWAALYIQQLAQRLTAVPADLEVHVFADKGTVRALLSEQLPPWLLVHQPHEAKEAQDRLNPATARRTSAAAGGLWAAWIMSGLNGEALRAMHVVLDGAFDLDRPLLVLSPDPEKPVARSECAWVAADEVLAVANAIGADTLSFGSPPHNPADVASRIIADSIGQRRAGPTMYSSLEKDPTGAELADAYAFAFDRSGDIAIPRLGSLFAYLQPEHVQASLRHAWPDKMVEPAEQNLLPQRVEMPGQRMGSRLEEHYRNAKSVPSWIASSDRYLGKKWAGLAKQAESSAPTASIKGAYNKGTAEALSQLREIVDRHASSS